jgi:hypothetical protein
MFVISLYIVDLLALLYSVWGICAQEQYNYFITLYYPISCKTVIHLHMQYSNFFIAYGGIWKMYLDLGWARKVKVIVKGYYLLLLSLYDRAFYTPVIRIKHFFNPVDSLAMIYHIVT